MASERNKYYTHELLMLYMFCKHKYRNSTYTLLNKYINKIFVMVRVSLQDLLN